MSRKARCSLPSVSLKSRSIRSGLTVTIVGSYGVVHRDQEGSAILAGCYDAEAERYIAHPSCFNQYSLYLLEGTDLQEMSPLPEYHADSPPHPLPSSANIPHFTANAVETMHGTHPSHASSPTSSSPDPLIPLHYASHRV